ncbi:MAG TPA: hypothetical protein VME23_13745 [Terracidiphilus sp.]|nr:hypothetical protein [Terracidiphilus sp.]
MSGEGNPRTSTAKSTGKNSLSGALPVLALIYVLGSFMIRHYQSMPVYLRFIFVVIIALGAGWVLLLGLFAIGLRKIYGTVAHVQIQSPAFTRIMQKRFNPEIRQLETLGFQTAFYFGESVSAFRLFLFLPAVVYIKMWIKGEPLALYGGFRIVNGNPVLVAKDRSAYVHPSGLGVTFHTGFRDGTILMTRSYESGGQYAQKVIMRCLKAPLAEMWAAHQREIESIATGLNPVDRQSSFEFYSAMDRKATPTDI